MAEGMYEAYNCVFDGSISGNHYEMERRPYHRNCGCAVHQFRGGGGRGCPHLKCDKVSYPVRRSWSQGSLCLATSSNNTNTLSPGLALIHSSSSSSLTWDQD